MELPNKEDGAELALSDYRWLTLELLEPGMVLARPVVVAARGTLVMKLGKGCALTPSLISQMYARGIECVAIAIPPPEEDETWQARCAAHAQRLKLIFSDGQAPIHPDCQPLYDLLVSQGLPR